jgi:hypothetical protein
MMLTTRMMTMVAVMMCGSGFETFACAAVSDHSALATLAYIERL